MKGIMEHRLIIVVLAAMVLVIIPLRLRAEHPADGVYDTNFGALTLEVRGNKVSGSYPHDAGKIEGVLEGNKLIGKWSEAPSYQPPRDAGEIEFVFPPNFKSFAGRWRYGFGGKEWGGDWHGVKTAAMAEEKVIGDWNTTWGKLTLKQTGARISGAYEKGNGKIDGTIQGNIIRGTWSQPPDYKPPDSAGDFMLVLSVDRNSFSGKYRRGFAEDKWDGNLTGTRSSNAGYEIVEGAYMTERGKLTIKQSGSKITGSYEQNQGKIEGTVEGREIRGRWMEAPSYKPPKHAGLFRFAFSEDRKSFKGRWHYGLEEKEWRQDWDGKRVE